jgi:hypothetical protein
MAHESDARVTRLPVRGAARGGWLRGRGGDPNASVLWLAGPGLRLLTLGDTMQLTPLLDDAGVSHVVDAGDGRLVALVAAGGEVQAVEFDLDAADVEPRTVGAAFRTDRGETAILAPDAAGALVYGPRGARYVDFGAGASELVHGPVRSAAWLEAER